MKKILLASIAILFLATGCGSKTLICTATDEQTTNPSKLVVKVKFVDDKATTVETDVTASVNEDDKEKKELALKELEDYYKKRDKINGVDAKFDIKEGIITIKFNVDFTKMSEKEKEDLNMDEFNQSYDVVKKMLVKDDYKCN